MDVLFNKEDDTVTVNVNYKPTMFEPPLCQRRHRYFFADIQEELERQGVILKKGTTSAATLDHTSGDLGRHSITLTLPLAVKKLTKPKKNATVVEEEVKEETTPKTSRRNKKQ
tara:strand:+ start:285 stop:623 length:339 start_codon:yes stop_codon:yes gene_type:complete